MNAKSMTLEESFEALMKQNEFLSKKIQEDAAIIDINSRRFKLGIFDAA